MKKNQILTKGIIKENPVLVLILGTCPTLAVSTTVKGAIGMGLASTFVLLCSNVVISALRNTIPNKVRIPAYIVLIAGFVTLVQMIIKTYAPELNDLLGIYLPLIVVNCIILGRAEAFANKNSIVDSALDGIGMGIGFTFTLFLMATIREVIGSGTWFGMNIPGLAAHHISILALAPGGFFVFGCLMALINKIMQRKPIDPEKMGGHGCSENCAIANALLAKEDKA